VPKVSRCCRTRDLFSAPWACLAVPVPKWGTSTLVQAKWVRSSMEVVLANRKALRTLAVAFGFALPLASAGAAAADAYVSSDNNATNSSDQSAHVGTKQFSLSNSGFNLAESATEGSNWTDQDANSNADGGNVDGFFGDDTEENDASNASGDATNDSTSDNTGTASASVTSGSADASNSSNVTGAQDNSSAATIDSTTDHNTVETDDDHDCGCDNAFVSSSNNATNSSTQSVGVWTGQAAVANSGFNAAGAFVGGSNNTTQSSNTNASGGNVYGGGDDTEGNTASNTSGNAGNTSSSSNNGTATSSVSSGNASASNSSTVGITQTNSGGASVTSSTSGNEASTE
jgi:hypothetical protein